MKTEAQREYNRQYAKTYYWKHRAACIAYHKQRYQKKLKPNPEWRQKRAIWEKSYRERNKEKLAILRREWQQKNRIRRLELSRISHYRRKYGITIAERDALFAANEGLCHICSKRPSEVIDHDHCTGRVRGALCHPCNRMLGAIFDEPEVLLSAADYLRRELCPIS